MTFIPNELIELDRWVRHTQTKVPLSVRGYNASSTKKHTWSSYERAINSTAGVGIGFMLNGDGIMCVDLDHCLVDGSPIPDVEQILSWIPPDTYVEVSPSGTGLHVWGTGAGLVNGRRFTVDGCAVEIYADVRYITVTNRPFANSPSTLGNIQQLIDYLLLETETE